MDEYLVGLSDSSDSPKNSDDGRWVSFDELELIMHPSYENEEEKIDEVWTVWLDPILNNEKVIETRCAHFFHKQWLKTSYQRGNELCPNWRRNLISDEESSNLKNSEQNGLLNGSSMTRSSFNSTIDT
jgi:hypothetical protein